MPSMATHPHLVPLRGRAESSRRLQNIPSASTTSHTTPVAALPHVLIATCALHAIDRPVTHAQKSRNWRRSAERSCRRARPCTAASIAPKLAQAPAPAMVTARYHSQTTHPCNSSLQMATMSSNDHRVAQMTARPHCCLAARAWPPNARADYPLVAPTAPSSFPASVKGGTSSCGSTPPDSRNVHPMRQKGAKRVERE